MSEENLALTRRWVDAINERDLDGALALMDEDVESISRIVAIEGALRGHDGYRRWWDAWFGTFPDYRIEIVEMQDHGDVVIGAFRAVGHGVGSELPFEDIAWNTSRWRKGKCVWWRVCLTEAEALQAAGLSE
jgi:ketosteroid isomerase-like protein